MVWLVFQKLSKKKVEETKSVSFYFRDKWPIKHVVTKNKQTNKKKNTTNVLFWMLSSSNLVRVDFYVNEGKSCSSKKCFTVWVSNLNFSGKNKFIKFIYQLIFICTYMISPSSSYVKSTESLPYQSLLLADPLDGSQCPHRADEGKFLLVGQH